MRCSAACSRTRERPCARGGRLFWMRRFSAPPSVTRRALAGRLGVPFQGLWLAAPKGLLAERIVQRKGDASDADLGVLERQFERFAQNDPATDENWRRTDASGAPDAVLDHALSILNGLVLKEMNT